MTVEERLQRMIGQQAFSIAMLETQVEQAQRQIAELQRTVRDQSKAKK